MKRALKLGIFVLTIVLIMLGFNCLFLSRGEKAPKGLSDGERFHLKTSLTRRGVPDNVFSRRPKKPSKYKTYSGAKLIKLPKPEYTGMSLEVFWESVVS